MQPDVIVLLRLDDIAWELRDGTYVEVARIHGEETLSATPPFEVALCPADLVR